MARSKQEGERSELNFNDDAPASESRTTRFPAARVRTAGVSGEDISADDLSPETLLHEEGEDSPEGLGATPAADRELTDISEEEAGLGTGLDEAELANQKP